MLKHSATTRTGRSCKVQFPDREQPVGVSSHADSFLRYAAHIVADVEVVAALWTGPALTACRTVEKVRAFLRSLPSRFDAGHVSLVLVLDNVRVEGALFDAFSDLLEQDRPEMILKSLSLDRRLVNLFSIQPIQIIKGDKGINSLISRSKALKL